MISGMDRTNRAAGADHGARPEPRLVRAAHEFEALMMKELLEPMGGGTFEETDGGGGGVMGEFASESLAGALSTAGGLGIAARILHEVSRDGNGGAAALRGENPRTISTTQ